MKILAFTGMPFSGKTEAVQIAKNIGIQIIRMGEAVWDEVENRRLDLNDKNVGMIANDMRKKHGMDIWARRTIKKINILDEKDLIVIDGIRNIEEIDTFKKELGKNFFIIAIESSNEARYKRAMSRGREDDSKNLDKVKERDKRELGWGLGAVIASADIVISNENGLDEFRELVKKNLLKFR
jgi:dephospho-CoA kinase